MYWAGQKVHSAFSVQSYGKTQMNLLANTIHKPIHSPRQNRISTLCKLQLLQLLSPLLCPPFQCERSFTIYTSFCIIIMKSDMLGLKVLYNLKLISNMWNNLYITIMNYRIITHTPYSL